MAVPKRKTSKSRRDQRRGGNFRLKVPNIITCKHCEGSKLPHHTCPGCGQYE